MKHVKTEVLVPGMVVATDVIANGKQLVFPKGYKLTERAIARLEGYGIRDIRIEDPVDLNIEVEEIPEDEVADSMPTAASMDSLLSALSSLDFLQEERTAEEAPAATPDDGSDSSASAAKESPKISVTQQEEPSHFEKLKASKEFQSFKQSFSKNVDSLRANLNEIVEKNTPINVDHMIGDTMMIISNQGSTFGVFDMLHNMRDFDDLTFAHSMNVAMICNVFARWLRFSEEDVKTATACGMMHDIGKLKIDDAIIKKPGKLTAEEFRAIQSHPVEGYRILQPQNIDMHIKLSALEHHEKCDGSGYPMKLTGDKIDSFAKIVAIADIYDAMTANRVYREGMCPFRVIETFEEEGFHKYEVAYIMKFLENVVNTYIDNRVMLNDGRIGTVRWINKQRLSKPMLEMTDGTFLELGKERGLRIDKIL
ncbi:MAG: HD-GYP domain-containing protein [Lachnospiraceae bacterium]|nr:HD-GYP domain-containing protein [Lachnospiraceae bacterium]